MTCASLQAQFEELNTAVVGVIDPKGDHPDDHLLPTEPGPELR
jgi:hypothetical protein